MANVEEAFRLLYALSLMTNVQTMKNQSSNPLSSSIIFSDMRGRYRTFVRIGSGLSFADYVWLRAKPWKTWDPKEPPSFLLTASKSHDDKGDVYLEPEEYTSMAVLPCVCLCLVWHLVHLSSRSRLLRSRKAVRLCHHIDRSILYMIIYYYRTISYEIYHAIPPRTQHSR